MAIRVKREQLKRHKRDSFFVLIVAGDADLKQGVAQIMGEIFGGFRNSSYLCIVNFMFNRLKHVMLMKRQKREKNGEILGGIEFNVYFCHD